MDSLGEWQKSFVLGALSSSKRTLCFRPCQEASSLGLRQRFGPVTERSARWINVESDLSKKETSHKSLMCKQFIFPKLNVCHLNEGPVAMALNTLHFVYFSLFRFQPKSIIQLAFDRKTRPQNNR